MEKHSSRRDLAQINKLIYDETNNANRVINVGDIETTISLSHKDGDTIATHAASRVLSPGTHDCDDLQKFQAYGTGNVTIYANEETSYEYAVYPGLIIEFCGMSLKTEVTLVGR